MIYFGNPCGDAVIAAMGAGQLGLIDTPYQGKVPQVRRAHAAGAVWCADNGAFSSRWTADTWWPWLVRQTPHRDRCRFAVAPDVVADHDATVRASAPWLHRIRGLGFPVALVAQNGIETSGWDDWDAIDALFLGGDDPWKLGPGARRMAAEARARGKWVHMGRVNSERRYAYAEAIGCDSVDGTYLTFGPDLNLPDVLAWGRRRDQLSLF